MPASDSFDIDRRLESISRIGSPALIMTSTISRERTRDAASALTPRVTRAASVGRIVLCATFSSPN
jgi:hypothetical protein